MLKRFQSLKIQSKLVMGFCLVAVFIIIVGLVGLLNMKNINTAMIALTDKNLKKVLELNEIQTHLMSIRGTMWETLALKDANQVGSWLYK